MRFIREGGLHKQFGKKRADIPKAVDSEQIEQLIAGMPESTSDWNDVQRRTFHRQFLEAACPRGIPRRTGNGQRVLAYLGKGEYLGEMGVLDDQPRSATCIALDHPETGQDRVSDARGLVPSRVELVRIPAEDFRKLKQSSAEISRLVDEEIVRRKMRSSAPPPSGVDIAMQSPPL